MRAGAPASRRCSVRRARSRRLRLALRLALRFRLRLGLSLRLRSRAVLLGGGAALALAVVGVVEARALEVDRDGVEHALHRGAALRAFGERIVAHALHGLEHVAVVALVLVDRHRRSEYRSAKNPVMLCAGTLATVSGWPTTW